VNQLQSKRTRPDLVGLLPDEITDLLTRLDEPPYRGRQVFSWIHDKRVTLFDQMTNLPKPLREGLSKWFIISTMAPSSVIDSKDGSRKLVFDVDGGSIASVLMPNDDRVTLCVSSQVGCRMGCKFCLTSRMGLTRNLSTSEIVGQILAAARIVEPGRRISNVVLMGMGEPLDNLDNVVNAVRVITHREGLKVAPRRTTVSTVGLMDRLKDFLRADTRISIALSLCGTTDESRRAITPIGKRYDLETTVATLRSLQLGPGHKYTVEYLLIAGVSDSIQDARRLSRMLARFPSKVNLIPFNPWQGTRFDRPPDRKVEAFRRFLSDKNHLVTVRASRGLDVGAACGQLGREPGGSD